MPAMRIPVRLVVAAVAVATAAATVVARRPVKPPETSGTWLPAARQRTRR
jgi:hypothetical protein